MLGELVVHLSVRKWKGADLLPLQMDRAYYLSRDVHFVHCCLLCRKGKAFDQIFQLTVFMVELCLLFAPVNLSVSTTG
jgi:hypothetical protein